MILNPGKKALFLLPWALAAFLICTGSLINFHQYKIWHNPLLPQLVIHKKDLEKTPTDIVLEKIRNDRILVVFHFFTNESTHGISTNTILVSHPYIYYDDPDIYRDDLAFLNSHGLRAPPLV